MKTILRAADRGHADHGWLQAHHSFSFGEYYNPQQMGFRSLRVLNDDTVLGGSGFDTHPHRDMEIITYILSGALQHRDSLGTSQVMKAGDVQRISAGTGIRHSEFNYSPVDPVHLLQIWILPDRKGATPAYAQKSFAAVEKGKFHLVASKSGRAGSITINQDADIYLAKLEPGHQLSHSPSPGRHLWIHVATGAVTVDGESLQAGDALALSDQSNVELQASEPSQVLLFDLN